MRGGSCRVDGRFVLGRRGFVQLEPEDGPTAATSAHTRDGTLIGTAGHVHPGGLFTELDLIRSGATRSNGAIAGPVPNSVRLFRSYAHYWDPRGPISWDMAMQATAPDWRPKLNVGDQLRISATYETG